MSFISSFMNTQKRPYEALPDVNANKQLDQPNPTACSPHLFHGTTISAQVQRKLSVGLSSAETNSPGRSASRLKPFSSSTDLTLPSERSSTREAEAPAAADRKSPQASPPKRKNSSSNSSNSPNNEPFAYRVTVGVLYGLINSAVTLPVMMSFGTIIFHDEAFNPYLPTLIKLTLVSSMVHQLCFSTFSTLPYAVGQVQDAGLIFLSAMSTMIVTFCKKGGYSDDQMLATATIGLSLCTAALGVGLMIIGKASLASYVQLLPTTVVGGYLAYIGWFCGQSGVGLMAGVEITELSDWSLILSRNHLTLCLPGIVGGLLVYGAARKFRHMAVLPACMLGIIGTFYLVLHLLGVSVSEARSNGWIGRADPSGPWTETWKFLVLDNVVWAALPQLTVTLLSMTMVVALSSALDIAAIELELEGEDQELDYDNELVTVGLSNFLSGMTGGYTGSYIFSQTIFTLRSGVRDRYAGFTIAFLEGLIVIAPFPVVAYIPKLFFGSLLTMIACDLMFEWLWQVRAKLTKAEYCVCLGTFVIIMLIGVEWGILAGIALDWGVRKGLQQLQQYRGSEGGGAEGGAEDEEKQFLVV